MKRNFIYRYERKFLINNLSKQKVESIIKINPANFKEIYKERIINNIYFDTLSQNSYSDNIDGNMDRIKSRIRWYGTLFGEIANPNLEFKIKKGLLGKKSSYALNGFKLDSNFQHKMIMEIISLSNLPLVTMEYIQHQNPILLNSYSRKYYLSSDKKYRITIDSVQIFYKIGNLNNSFSNKYKDNTNIILELKYDEFSDDNAHQITKYFPFRLTKSSKYTTGIERILGALQ
jgi:hypothetical protein